MEEIKKEDDTKKEDISLNIDKDKIIYYIKRYNIFLLLLIPIFLAIFYRAYTYDLPITEDFAQNSVYQSIESQIRSQIIQQAPDIDQETLNQIAAQRTNEYIQQNQQQLKQNIVQTREFIVENYQDDSGQTYLLAIDPYHYYRQAKNILDHGHVGDELRDGKPLDNHMLAPNGRIVAPSLHPYLIAITHRISSVFGNDSVMASSFILPLIIMALATIPCFFIIKRFAGKLGATLGASILAIHPSILGRTPAGFSDTDAYNIFFPLTITWLLFESFRTKIPKYKLLFAALSGLATGLYAFAWSGYWSFFDVVLATIGFYIIYLIIKYRKEFYKKKLFKNIIKTSATYIISSSIFILLFTNFRYLVNTVTAPIDAIFLKQAAHPSLWPNVYTTVAELNEISFTNIISNVGGNLLVILAFIGPIIILLTKKHFSSRLKYSLLIIIWLIVTLYASTKGMRFILLIIPAYAIGIGILTGTIYNKILKFSHRSLKLNKVFIAMVLIILLAIAFQPMLIRADNTAKGEVPSMDDSWYQVLTKIKENSNEKAIITSWWDFGHWFKAIADRPVTFDGASQNSPKAHWVGKILLTSDEHEAMGILRMLDCKSEQAYNLLLEKTNNKILTKKIIDQIILEDKETARKTLSQYTDNPEEILETTHCDPPEAFVITSEDMVGKSGVWSHFGSWDFERAFTYNTIKANSKQNAIKILTTELNYTEEEASDLYLQLKGIPESDGNAWIAGYPGYANTVSCATLENETIMCQNGVQIKDGEATIETSEGVLNFAFFRDDKEVYKKDEGIKDFAIAYVPERNILVSMSPALLESMFTELYYYDGKNLKHFELFDKTIGFNSFEIYTWKVKWNSL